ncbi:MAG TPA: acyl-CoA dehydrogenase [Nitriliruptoraceae bacterium]|nr:acyl-CoA dehydrogenase [Nitriliruptoraceae bacterium]
MDFTINEDHQMLAETLRRFLADAWDPETRAVAAYEAPFHQPDAWSQLCEMGVLGALVDEEAGGFGGTGLDIMVMFEELGRALAPEPLLGTLLALRLLVAADAGDDVAALMTGERRAVMAWAEPHDLEAVDDITTKATRTGDGDDVTVSGRKSAVYGGPGADVALVTAMLDGALAVVAVDLADVEVTGYAMIDGGGAAELVMEDAPGRVVMEDASAAVHAALDAGRLALCAEAVGAADRLFDLTLGYLRDRKQFGRPLATFQALQHRVVDLSIELEQARSITILAASSLDGPDSHRHVAMAKHLVGKVARLVAEESIQLHGGIGMTWEYPGAHIAKRLVMLDAQLGDADMHLRELASSA